MRRPAGGPAIGSGDSGSGQPEAPDGSPIRCLPSLRRIRRVGVQRPGSSDGSAVTQDRDPDEAPAATLTLLTRDLPGQERERGCLEQAEADSVVGQLVESPSVIQPTAGNRTHLVVELGPTGSPTVVAEANECGCLGRWARLSGRA